MLFTGYPLLAGSPSRVGLALSGGGAKGIAHVGVLKVLEEAGIHFIFQADTTIQAMASPAPT